MLKLSMCLVIVCCSTMVGNWYSLRLKCRRKSLLVLIEAISRMKSHFVFSGYDINRIVSESFSGCKNFEGFCDFENDSDEFHKCWEQKVSLIPADAGLSAEDKRLLIRFSEVLGITDIEGQISNCDFYIDVFSQRLKSAETNEEKNSRLYKILGFSLGCIVTLVVL